MSDLKPHWSFWVISGLALIWSAMGAMNFASQLSPESVAQFPEKYQQLIASRPAWATGAFGIMAVTSVLGSILLLLRRTLAIPVLVIAFLAVLVTLLPAAPVQMVSGQFTTFEMILTVVMPIAVSIGLVWYANAQKRKGLLR